MKLKRLLSFLLPCLLVFPFTVNMGAIHRETLENPSVWKNPVEVPVLGDSAPQEKCFYFIDLQQNCFYISIVLKRTMQSLPSVSAQAIITTQDGTRQLIDISESGTVNSTNGVSSQAKLLTNDSDYYQFVAALEFDEHTQYEIMIVYVVNGVEVRLKNPISFDSTPVTTVKETVDKTTKATTKRTDPKQGAKATTKKQAVKAAAAPTKKAAQNGDGGSFASGLSEESATYTQQTLVADDAKNFFQSMSKPARAVFIAAVVLGATALVAVGMALGNRHTKQNPEPEKEETQAEKDDSKNE